MSHTEPRVLVAPDLRCRQNLQQSLHDDDQINVLGICGSLRRDPFSRRLLMAAETIAGSLGSLAIADIGANPLFDEDVETKRDPAPVSEFKRAIDAADALMIATPEYQHGLPGVLKNALDWASRPAGKSVLDGKVAAIMGATPSEGETIGAQVQLRETLEFTNTLTVLQPEVLIADAPNKLTADRRLSDLDDLARPLQRAPVSAG